MDFNKNDIEYNEHKRKLIKKIEENRINIEKNKSIDIEIDGEKYQYHLDENGKLSCYRKN